MTSGRNSGASRRGYVLAHQPHPAGAQAVELRLLRYTALIPPAGRPSEQRWVATELYRARLAPARP